MWLRAFAALRKPLLNEKNKNSGYLFSLKHLNMANSYWFCGILTDETKIKLFGDDTKDSCEMLPLWKFEINPNNSINPSYQKFETYLKFINICLSKMPININKTELRPLVTILPTNYNNLLEKRSVICEKLKKSIEINILLILVNIVETVNKKVEIMDKMANLLKDASYIETFIDSDGIINISRLFLSPYVIICNVALNIYLRVLNIQELSNEKKHKTDNYTIAKHVLICLETHLNCLNVSLIEKLLVTIDKLLTFGNIAQMKNTKIVGLINMCHNEPCLTCNEFILLNIKSIKLKLKC
ncbi:hypothetical protein A3Q56_06483 [Intoshia linei]|uniref:Uncharacterized protein n=1 Tax=Intoshia linei TaxID=1819745 RepID=A0A177AVD9_9BILA|nr:hypothetical protein A3Q56_06483 [Intoshia linei]